MPFTEPKQIKTRVWITANDTLTTVYTRPTTNDSTHEIFAQVSAISADGAECGGGAVHAKFKNDGGVLTIISWLVQADWDFPDWTFDATDFLVVSGTDILVKVKGKDADISWRINFLRCKASVL